MKEDYAETCGRSDSGRSSYSRSGQQVSGWEGQKQSRPVFKVGDKVLHEKWGKGVIVSTKDQGGNLTYQIAFPDQKGIRTVLAEYAPLKPL